MTSSPSLPLSSSFVLMPSSGFEGGSQARANRSRHSNRESRSSSVLEVLDDPQSELALVRSCIGFPRFGFTLRSAPPEDIEKAVKEFDAMMNDVAEKRFKMVLKGDIEKQWHLPIRFGRIGIQKAQDVMTPAYLGNVFATFPYVQELVGIDSVG